MSVNRGLRVAIIENASSVDGWNVTYDKNGNVLAGGNSNYSEAAWTYTYDNLNRLVTAVSSKGAGYLYAYDTFGNRTSETPQAGSCFNSSFTYSGNRISTPGYQYDAAGNLTYDGINTYAYDGENRLLTNHNSSTTVGFQYSPNGMRTDKTVNGVDTKYMYAPDGRLFTTNFGTGTPENVYFNGRHAGYMYADNSNETLKSYTYSDLDWLGSENARFDINQKTVGSFYHFPFGDGQTTVSGVDDDTLHFTGKERDTESGNDYFGARYYGSSMGRWGRADD